MNNGFYLINLKHGDLTRTKNGIMFGIQQLNMGLFCTIVRKCERKKDINHFCLNRSVDIEMEEMGQTKSQKMVTKMIINSAKTILRMEIASLKRYAQICLTDRQNVDEMSFLFFTPSEELCGGNIFSKVSNKFNVMQPYLEKIDREFIQMMN